MAGKKKVRLTLEDLVDLECQLHRDGASDRRDLRRRDRTIGLALAGKNLGRRALFLAWLDAVRGEGGEDLPGRKAGRAVDLASVVLVLLGLMVGCGAALGVFAYDGARPVNVVNVLGLFVFLQVFLLLLLVLVVLPRKWVKWLPGASDLQDLLRFLSPGRLLPAIARLFPKSYRDSLAEGAGRLGAFSRTYGRLRFWLLARLSQDFALSFNMGALFGALCLVTFTDLVFAWNTTLDIEAEQFHRGMEILAAPWAWLWPQLAPDLELVNLTRYSRHLKDYIGPGPAGPEGVAGLGGWWPFLVACMVFYGLLPRLVTHVLSRLRFADALDRAPLNHADFQFLYERLTEPLAEFRSGEERSGPSENQAGGAASPETRPCPGGVYAAVKWACPDFADDVVVSMISRKLNCRVETVLRAGGADFEEDKEALAALEALPPGTNLAVVVKAWEPPTRDFSRFLAEARERISPEAAIVAAPVDADESGGCAPPAAADLEMWEKQMRRVGDPWLRTAVLTEE